MFVLHGYLHSCIVRNVLYVGVGASCPRALFLYSGFHFRPHMRTSSFFVPEDPKLQAGSGTGRLDLPTKSQWPFSE
jgi:hypothetical protein